MAAVQPNPANLNISTKLPPPAHNRTFSRSRSPSKSPTRKARFAARELDPLLKNLSPDSTLEALQETNIIKGNQEEQNAIAKSISDASEAERKLGIRAAIAAKKLHQWTVEVKAWPWPSSQDRAWGAGFVPPQMNQPGAPIYFGCLPKSTVERYEERLDEIWDAMETLGMDELKDFVFSSHHPQPPKNFSTPFSYGRMRDFTALITATVVQSLPVLANLKALLETWSVRLTVARQIPDFLKALDQVNIGLAAIDEIVKDDTRSWKLDKKELEVGKVMFGNKVSNLGKRVDTLLDLLEGQEDSLPRYWIDSLENIENKYAEWVAQAEQIVLRNQVAGQRPMTPKSKPVTPIASPTKIPLPVSPDASPVAQRGDEGQPSSSSASHSLPSSARSPTVIKRKPLLEVNPKTSSSHKRGLSDISMADSVLSSQSFENAEIVNAHAIPVLPSQHEGAVNTSLPTIQDAQHRQNAKNEASNPASPHRPLMVSRASTASVEIIPKDQIKKVVLRRSLSHDMLSSRMASPGTLQELSAQNYDFSRQNANKNFTLGSAEPIQQPIPSSLLSPNENNAPLSIRAPALSDSSTPAVPRRSSKRVSMPRIDPSVRPSTPPRKEVVDSASSVGKATSALPVTPPSKVKRMETFDDKLKSILASMPTKFRLTESSDSGSSGVSSTGSSRNSSPSRPLKLSPVKDSRSLQLNGASGVRVYHLKGGRSRDAAPIKLFVRAVGENGERIMVRVGGGWADLAEYLREYSLHHGGRSLAERKLQVASFPGSQPAVISTLAGGPVTARKEVEPAVKDAGFDFDLNNQPQKSMEDAELETNPWRPPPVPIVTPDYGLPIARSTTPNNNRAVRSTTPTPSPRPGSRISVNNGTTPLITTTVTPNGNYTPLGGAGPVQNNRRTASNTFARTPSNEAWVEGMVNQARAVSGSHAGHTSIVTPTSNITIIQSPTITVSTTITSRPRKSSTTRRVSFTNSPTISSTGPSPTLNNNILTPTLVRSPQESLLNSTSSGSNGYFATSKTSKVNQRNDINRPKTRASQGDVSGVRRVFLKKRDE